MEYHKYIYDCENKKIKGDFEAAYKECVDVWPTQHNMLAPHFSYIRGLLLKKREDSNSDLTVLDVGCGYGDFVNDLTNFNIGKIIGYDISPSAIAKGKERFGIDIDLRVGALLDINLPTKSCNVVLLLGVLWFLLDNLNDAFSKIDYLLSNEGEFILTLNVPLEPIRKEVIGSYQDLIDLISKRFTIIDAFHWYQQHFVRQGSFSLKHSDIMLRCEKRKVSPY